MGFVLAGALVGLLAGASAAVGAATPVRFGGSWSVVDTCTTSTCAGEVFAGTFMIVQKPSSSSFTGVNNIGETIEGTQSGLSAHFTLTLIGDPSELATFQVALSKDGSAFTGSWVYKNGTGGTTKATRVGAKPAYLDQFVGSGGRLTDLVAGKNGTKVEFILHDWDPAGGPITLSWGGKTVQSFTPPDPSAANFSTNGTFAVDEWPTRGTLTKPAPCTGTLVAKQGSVTRQLDLASGAPVAAVVYAEKTHGTLATGDLVCYGEYQSYRVDKGGAIVFATAPDNEYIFDVAISQPQPAPLAVGDPTAYLWIQDGERDIYANAKIDPSSLACVKLNGNRWFRITGGAGQLARSAITTGICAARVGAGAPSFPVPIAIARGTSDDVQLVGPRSYPTSLHGLNKVGNPGPATFASLDCPTPDTLLWSPDDITVSNGISGSCSITSGRRIEVRGPAETGGVLEAHKELLLYGR